MKLTSFEEGFVNYLTSLVWWFEVRWNKGIIFTRSLFCFWLPFFIALFTTVFTLGEFMGERTLFSFILLFVIVPISIGLFVSSFIFQLMVYAWFDEKVNVLKNTKLNPNPNKANVWVKECRLGVFTIISGIIITSFYGEASAVNPVIMFMFFVFLVPSMYILCVDPIPPTEKEKRVEKNKLNRMRLSPSPISG